jgi:hypothetical protein
MTSLCAASYGQRKKRLPKSLTNSIYPSMLPTTKEKEAAWTEVHLPFFNLRFFQLGESSRLTICSRMRIRR